MAAMSGATMSTDLYRVRMLKIKGNEGRFRVFIVHPNVDELPQSRSFALQLIWEPWLHMAEHYGEFIACPLDSASARAAAEAAPIGKAITAGQMRDSSFVVQQAPSYIRSVKLSS